MKYGTVIRYGPNRLLFNSVAAVQDIYQSPSITKSHLYALLRLGGSASRFSTIENHHHRQKRQLFLKALSERSMRAFEPTMLQHIDTFLKLISKASQSSQPVEMTSRLQHLSFDIVGSLALGQRLDLQTDETNRVLPRLLIAAKTRVRKFSRILTDLFAKRKAQGDDGKHDLYSFLTKPEAEGIVDRVASEIVFFMTAGGTPPATTLCALVFYVTRYPTCYKILTREIRSAFSDSSAIKSGPQLASCKYLRACIDESMRINPPSLATLWREQADESQGPVIIDGHVVPRGTQVGVNIYALHHSEEYFPDPFAFKPERWLETDTPGTSETRAARAKMHKAFIPFIVGPRACAGKATLYMEVSLVMAKTLWFFDFETAPGPPGRVGEGEAGKKDGRGRVEESQMFDVFNSHHHGPNLVFRPRGELYKDIQ